ncbi:SDR family oxidoreductase [Hydrogenophaga sp. RAC07]|uniref:SDR family oxidoreductase n=1 Tax=Hydrogenophaga sp. RAC07 TaxID=1842537 RepID=UPI0021502A25|nr:SDR family oxidoreductase [Hydrogenophaga sp. RAC07]
MISTECRRSRFRFGRHAHSIGKGSPPRTSAAYVGAKSAVMSYAKAFAREAAHMRITAKVVVPGLIDTEMLRSTFTSSGALTAAAQNIPLDRISKVDDLAAAVDGREGFVIGRGLATQFGTPQAQRGVSVSLAIVGAKAQAHGKWAEAEKVYRECLSISTDLASLLQERASLCPGQMSALAVLC